jgi:hypothetical protein
MYYLLIAVGYFLGNWAVGRVMAVREPHWLVSRDLLLQFVGAAAALGAGRAGIPSSGGDLAPMSVLAFGQGLHCRT